jgi:hypothetical protein
VFTTCVCVYYCRTSYKACAGVPSTLVLLLRSFVVKFYGCTGLEENPIRRGKIQIHNVAHDCYKKLDQRTGRTVGAVGENFNIYDRVLLYSTTLKPKHVNIFVLGPAVINTHTKHVLEWCRTIVELLGKTLLIPTPGQARLFTPSNIFTSSSCSITTAKNGLRHQTPMLQRLAHLLLNSTTMLALFPFLPLTLSLLCVFGRMG